MVIPRNRTITQLMYDDRNHRRPHVTHRSTVIAIRLVRFELPIKIQK